MIKFFRNIRKRLIIENRLSKYLVYAIGEIVLVVIAIFNINLKFKTEQFNSWEG